MPLRNMLRQADVPTDGQSVVVGCSGGVDSSVTAALLQQAGCHVIGVFLKLTTSPLVDRALADVKNVAAQLGFQLIVVEAQRIFEAAVLEPFVKAYSCGQTPSPCCLCNPLVKFHILDSVRQQMSAEFLATGHYARLVKRGQLDAAAASELANFGACGECFLAPAQALERDQSYFLWGVSSDVWAKTCFPLGTFRKEDVRRWAEELKLPVSQKPDSQDICFLQGQFESYTDFLDEWAQTHDEAQLNRALAPGNITDKEGRVLGRHGGVAHYTVGQRRGLGLSTPQPLYVTAISSGDIIVGEKADLRVNQIALEETRWHRGEGSEPSPDLRHMTVFVQFRSTMAPVKATLQITSGTTAIVTTTEPQWGVALGQALVARTAQGFVLGGGWIGATGFGETKTD